MIGQMAVDAILMGMLYAIVAIGLALIWGVADIVNFAHGGYLLIAMLSTVYLTTWLNVDPLLLLPFNTALLFVLGYLSYKYLISKVMSATMLSQILLTFGLLLVIQHGAFVLVGPSARRVDEYVFSGSMTVQGLTVSQPQVVAGIGCLLTLAMLGGFLKYSRTGKAIRATAQNWDAARVVGIDPDYVFGVTWGIGIATVGIAGTFLATIHPVQVEVIPLNWTLIAFAGVALGGFGNIIAAGLGGLGISFVEQSGIRWLDSSYRELYIFAVFLLAILARTYIKEVRE